jgi:signal transduction histidine kinase
VAFQDDGTLRPNALLNGILVMRWGVLVWMSVLLVVGRHDVQPLVGWGALAMAAAWTAYLTVGRARWTLPILVGDLAVASALLVLNATVPTLATIYPVTAALSWGARRGAWAGLGAGAVLGSVLVTAHLAGGMPLRLDAAQTVAVLGSALNLVLAGAGIGVVSTLLQRSARQLRAAQRAELQAREAAARLTERERLGRQIHDSVLQLLAWVHKRGRELAAVGTVPGEDVARLADLAAEQEDALRHLLLRQTDPGERCGTASLQDRLERSARDRQDLEVRVNSVAAVTLPAATVQEIGAAVDEALANVAKHAGTRRAWVLADVEDDAVVVTVRDDGSGFVLDEAALLSQGRLGLIGSIRGRITDLGGSVVVDTAPGRGTEVELRVPLGVGLPVAG